MFPRNDLLLIVTSTVTPSHWGNEITISQCGFLFQCLFFLRSPRFWMRRTKRHCSSWRSWKCKSSTISKADIRSTFTSTRTHTSRMRPSPRSSISTRQESPHLTPLSSSGSLARWRWNFFFFLFYLFVSYWADSFHFACLHDLCWYKSCLFPPKNLVKSNQEAGAGGRKRGHDRVSFFSWFTESVDAGVSTVYRASIGVR